MSDEPDITPEHREKLVSFEDGGARLAERMARGDFPSTGDPAIDWYLRVTAEERQRRLSRRAELLRSGAHWQDVP